MKTSSISKSTKNFHHSNTTRPVTKSFGKKSILEKEKGLNYSNATTKKTQPVIKKKKKQKVISQPLSAQSEVISHPKMLTQEETLTQNENNTYTDFSENIINEKRTKDSLRRLIGTSNDLLTQQNAILSQCDELAKTISANDYEIDRMKVKQESENFPQVVNTYSENLDNILEKLRKHTNEIENAKKLREENNSLKYKIEMLSIDKSDDYLNIESQLHSVRNVYANEMNSMINFFNELGIDNNPIQKITNQNFSEDKVINFFSLIKTHMKNMKLTILNQEEQIKYLSNENLKISHEVENIKKQTDNFIRRKNIDFNESCNMNNYNSYNNQNFISTNVDGGNASGY